MNACRHNAYLKRLVAEQSGKLTILPADHMCIYCGGLKKAILIIGRVFLTVPLKAESRFSISCPIPV